MMKLYTISTVCLLSGTAQGWLSPLFTPRLVPRSFMAAKDDDGAASDGPVEYNDFDDFIGDSFSTAENNFASSSSSSPSNVSQDDDEVPILKDDLPSASSSSSTEQVVVPLPKLVPDRSACRTRRFSLGPEVVLDRYLGTLGFQEITDWQYYMTDQDEETGEIVGDRREKVSPNPFDPKQPRRTRESSGSVLRLFRGEFVGALGGLLRSQGLDNRVLIKEFSGELGLALADRETRALAQFQSKLVPDDDNDDWRNDAMNRFNNQRRDNINVQKIVKSTADCPFTILLGEVDLAEVEEEGWDANEFYRALGVQPPKPGAVWLVYEYTGVGASASRLTQASPAARWNQLPRKKGFFGPVEPDPLPPWSQRADFCLKGIIARAVEAVADTHEQGVVHRSLGVSSLLVLPRRESDKSAALSPLWSNVAGTMVKFSDWGFSQATDPDVLLQDEDFVRRARSFEINLSKSSSSLLAVNFALAEDMHALGVAVVQLLLSTLAEPLSPLDPLPTIATNEDTFQRVWTDIYDQDMSSFRDYLINEEVYKSLVSYMDEREGWKFLEALLNARERVAKMQGVESIVTVRQLLESPILK